jgi:succinate-semialdehyde dehydrogenase/glutarate-semialdehyde dehydrogenase
MHNLPAIVEKSELFRTQAFIAGDWYGNSDDVIEVVDPATRGVIGTVPNLAEAAKLKAIKAAENAQAGWARQTANIRSDILHNWADLMTEAREDLAHIITLENGKPLSQARGEIDYATSFVRWFAEGALRADGDMIPSHRRDAKIMVTRQAKGVCAAITPWNFPSAMITRKAGAALAAGCAMVVKPAPETPFSALALADLARQAGLPDGLLSIITGSAEPIARAMMKSKIVKKISFTGSTAVGKQLMAQAADTVKDISLELGGNAPFLVGKDADITKAVDGAMTAKFRNAGQSCIGANRFIIHQSVADEFVDRLQAKMDKLTIGTGFDPGVDIGPMIHDRAVEKIDDLIADARGKGADLRLGGRRHDLGGGYYEPTLLTNCTPSMDIFQDEIFGPVACIYTADSLDQMITMANDTDYGLAAYAYTDDLGRAMRYSDDLAYGMVGINTGHISTAQAPFGGIKQSGIGREGSKYGINEYLDIKYTLLAGLNGEGE